jgi:hypothetical protein
LLIEAADDVVVDGFTLTGGHGTMFPRERGNNGGAIACFGPGRITVLGCVLTANRANNGAALAVLAGGTAHLRDCRVVANRSSWGPVAEDVGIGGAVLVDDRPSTGRSTLVMERSSIASNFPGAFILDSGSTVLRHCRILGNAGFVGVGIRVDGTYASLEAWNCLLAGNAAIIDAGDPQSAPGGGAMIVYNDRGRMPMALWNCTVVQNTNVQSFAGGIQFLGRLTLRNTIVWGNEPDDLFSHAENDFGLLSAIRCDVGLANGTPAPPTPLRGGNLSVDPQFVSPGIFDFAAWTTVQIAGEEVEMPNFIVDPGDYRLDSDSPLIDQGLASGAPDVDIDGNPRPCGEGADIGAYESGGCVPPELFVRGDSDASGAVNLTDAVFTLRHLFLAGERPPCLDAADADDGGVLTLSDSVFLLNALFLGGEPLPAPAGDCGEDPTQDTLACESYAPCPR